MISFKQTEEFYRILEQRCHKPCKCFEKLLDFVMKFLEINQKLDDFKFCAWFFKFIFGYAGAETTIVVSRDVDPEDKTYVDRTFIQLVTPKTFHVEHSLALHIKLKDTSLDSVLFVKVCEALMLVLGIRNIDVLDFMKIILSGNYESLLGKVSELGQQTFILGGNNE